MVIPMNESTVSLILAFLHNKKSKLFSNVQTSRHEGLYPYISITFCYSGLDVGVFVYNSTFIKLKVNNQPHTICDGINSFRDTIYRLNYYNYGRDY